MPHSFRKNPLASRYHQKVDMRIRSHNSGQCVVLAAKRLSARHALRRDSALRYGSALRFGGARFR